MRDRVRAGVAAAAITAIVALAACASLAIWHATRPKMQRGAAPRGHAPLPVEYAAPALRLPDGARQDMFSSDDDGAADVRIAPIDADGLHAETPLLALDRDDGGALASADADDGACEMWADMSTLEGAEQVVRRAHRTLSAALAQRKARALVAAVHAGAAREAFLREVHSNGNHSNGHYSERNHSDGHHSDEHHSDKSHSDGNHKDENHKDDHRSDEDHSDETRFDGHENDHSMGRRPKGMPEDAPLDALSVREMAEAAKAAMCHRASAEQLRAAVDAGPRHANRTLRRADVVPLFRAVVLRGHLGLDAEYGGRGPLSAEEDAQLRFGLQAYCPAVGKTMRALALAANAYVPSRARLAGLVAERITSAPVRPLPPAESSAHPQAPDHREAPKDSPTSPKTRKKRNLLRDTPDDALLALVLHDRAVLAGLDDGQVADVAHRAVRPFRKDTSKNKKTIADALELLNVRELRAQSHDRQCDRLEAAIALLSDA